MTRRRISPRVTLREPAHIDAALQHELGEQRDHDLTYPAVGATRSGRCPDGFDPLHVEAAVGRGGPAFEALASGIRQWAVHREAGLRLASSGPAAPGVDVALAKMLGPVAIVFACRVVWAVDEPGRVGFGYGTLPGHPESGEECFLAVRTAEDVVHFRVSGFSRPGTLLTRISAPIGGRLQRSSLSAYVSAARRLAVGS